MAIWQYQLHIIPRKSILDKYGEIPDALFINKEGWKRFWKNFNGDFDNIEYGFEDAWTIKWWKNIKFDIEGTVYQIDKLIKRGNWNSAKGFIGWKGDTKNEEDHDCHISFDEETKEVKEFQFRTDLRNGKNAKVFMAGMLEICLQNELMAMNMEGVLFDPGAELIFEDIKKSNATKFLNDPVGFIEKVVDSEDSKFLNLTNKEGVWKGKKK